jgi:hypothetical protein
MPGVGWMAVQEFSRVRGRSRLVGCGVLPQSIRNGTSPSLRSICGGVSRHCQTSPASDRRVMVVGWPGS